MKRKVNDETKVISHFVKKYGEIKISNKENLKGSVKITSFRQYYNFGTKISVEFKGEIFSSYNAKWYSHSDLPRLSKIRVYRLIRRNILTEVNLRLAIFGTSIKWWNDIDKLKWVG